uniref:Uncharacterized protein n=1 Tax=Arundo donax TaxID=35708 RepID=A0A0A8Z011_ARUDO
MHSWPTCSRAHMALTAPIRLPIPLSTLHSLLIPSSSPLL